MWSCAVILFLVACARAITRDQFYPHGPGLDQTLPKGHEVPSPEVLLKVPITFYGETYESVYVNNHGVLTFRADLPQFINTEFPLPYSTIAAFYTNVDTTDEGAVYYRETNESHVISKAEESVQNNFHEYYDFKPTSVFIASWIEVTYTSQTYGRKNSFQVAVISNGTETFVELLYPERDIQWIQRETQIATLPDAKAQAGFISEDGRMYTLRGSGSHQMRNIISWSNTHEPGKYVFRVGDIPPGDNIAVPDQYNQSELEVEEESKTCAQSGPSVCHIQARCVDYQAGICCQCDEGFYGNGKSCIKNDVPLRVHGKLNGVINDVNLNDVDIQSYVVVADGRTYTALSLAPPSLGSSLQLLNVLGGVVGWLFAKPLGSAKNGYQLTGSVFNHSADIWFPATGDRVTVNQDYFGHDVFDQISIETDVRGSLPVIFTGNKLVLGEYEEQYTIVEPGLIRSESTLIFTNKVTGENYTERVSQTISYNPCRYAPPSEEDILPLRLKIGKNYLGYESKENIVRYGMSSKITALGQEDPCIQGRSLCGPHSSCVVQGDSFACICEKGYTDVYGAGVCADIDECGAGIHNCDSNADCFNQDGGFECKCRAGFQGNGISCIKISPCAKKNCDPNADCMENTSENLFGEKFVEEPYCVCKPGFTGNGQQCYDTNESVCVSCSPYASCPYSEIVKQYSCRCNTGYSGDGFVCFETVREITTTEALNTNTEAEYNETFVLPQCDVFSCVCPPGYTNFIDERNNELCRIDTYDVPNSLTANNDSSIACLSDADCPPNAVCSIDSLAPGDEFMGHCTCPEGYVGDAYECIERTGSSCACGPNAHCTGTSAAELMCVCDFGYYGDGYKCRPNFSCTNNSDCEYNAECKPDPISHDLTCQCIVGYVKDHNEACIPNGHTCSGALCPEHASCLYDSTLEISYCHCDEGYEGDGILLCLPVGRTCDVANDCSPDALCMPYENSYQCVCRDGYTGDGYTCTRELSCRTDHELCSPHASCLKGSDGYVCECNRGYTGNGSICELNPRQEGNFLVTSDGTSIYRVPFQITAKNFATPINSGTSQIAVGVGVDCLAGRIYWGDVVSNNIKSVAYDGSGFEQFLSLGITAPEGIAIDWSARNIFWTDSKKLTIEVANLETKARKVLFAIDGISNPRGIAVHPQRGKIFWTDWKRSNPKIEWANMDGTQRGVFLDSTDVKLPNSVAIDFVRERLCYADAGLQSINCIGIDTLDKETVAENCTYPFGLAINGNKFYWSDWKTLKIEYVDTSTRLKGQIDIPKSTWRLYGVSIAANQCPSASNVCMHRNGGCQSDQLCLPNGQGGRTCVDGDKSYDEA